MSKAHGIAAQDVRHDRVQVPNRFHPLGQRRFDAHLRLVSSRPAAVVCGDGHGSYIPYKRQPHHFDLMDTVWSRESGGRNGRRAGPVVGGANVPGGSGDVRSVYRRYAIAGTSGTIEGQLTQQMAGVTFRTAHR